MGAGQFPKAAFGAVSDDRVSDLFCRRKADAHGRYIIAARPCLNDNTGPRDPVTFSGGQKFLAFNKTPDFRICLFGAY